MTSPFRVPRPQTEQEKAADRIRWHSIGRPEIERPRDSRLCCGENKYHDPCCAWGTHLIDGKRFCVAHRPAGAERR